MGRCCRNFNPKPKEIYFYLPKTTNNALKSLIKRYGCFDRREREKESCIEITQVFNPALLFYKFIPSDKKEGFNTKIAGEFFEAFANLWKRKDILKTNVEKLKNLHKWIIMSLLKDDWYICSDIQKKLQWRMVVGLGTNHPYEVSMKLHHIYGVPIIPGSALKGIARDMALLKIGDNLKQIEENIQGWFKDNDKKKKFFAKIKGEEFSNLTNEEKLLLAFGNQQFSGIVVFLDAIPDSAPKFKVDIMNPHYPEYYQGKNFPTDWQNPNPIKFLTVENTKFRFTLLVNKARLNRNDKDDYAKDVANYAWEMLKEALEELGVGAKTSVGYGYFNDG